MTSCNQDPEFKVPEYNIVTVVNSTDTSTTRPGPTRPPSPPTPRRTSAPTDPSSPWSPTCLSCLKCFSKESRFPHLKLNNSSVGIDGNKHKSKQPVIYYSMC